VGYGGTVDCNQYVPDFNVFDVPRNCRKFNISLQLREGFVAADCECIGIENVLEPSPTSACELEQKINTTRRQTTPIQK
jgi:hypothetical protein